jgi:hypothetical protein
MRGCQHVTAWRRKRERGKDGESRTVDGGQSVAAALRAALQKWQLDEKKLSAITTDNAANISAAIRSLHWPWLNCFGHNLNLAVTNALHYQRQKPERALGQ